MTVGTPYLRVALSLTVVLTACKAQDAATASAANRITYDGSTVVSGLLLPAVGPPLEKRTGVRFGAIGTSGAGKGLKAALAGQVDVAGVTRSLTEEELARKPYYQIVGYDALGIWVNEANPVRSLTKAQVKAIYTGQVKSWKAVGGKDIPIVVCSEKLDSAKATVETVKAIALDGAAYGPTREFDLYDDCLKLVGSDLAAIGAGSVASTFSGTRALALDGILPAPENVRSGAYLLSRPVLFVTRSVPSGGLQQFFEFMLSPEGQAIVGQKFIPVR